MDNFTLSDDARRKLQVAHDAVIEVMDYKGRQYREFEAKRDPGRGPGWYVFGRCIRGVGTDCYGGGVVMNCARPATKARRHPHYNGQVTRGWWRKRDAEVVARAMSAELPHPPAITQA